MPSKNDISAFKVQAARKLDGAAPQKTELQGWRAAKPKAEKQSVVIGLKFTPTQAATIKNKAGLVPVATYVKDALFNQTNLFK